MFIVGNCQVRGLADALRIVFPDDLIIDIRSWDFTDVENTVAAMNYLRSLDVQIRMPLEDSPLSPEDIGYSEHQLVLQIPSITFPAFHPDMVYARGPDGELFRGNVDYHSAIGLWAWCHGLEAEEAAQLFSDDVLAGLSYDDYWDASVAALRESVDASDLEFPALWARLHRLGLFMHTINHPNSAAIAVFAKAIAVRLGAPAEVWRYPLERYVPDYCSSEVWPVYPIVGRRLGLTGAWHWRLQERQILSVADWLGAAYASYDDRAGRVLDCPRLYDGLYDKVIGAKLDEIGLKRV